MRAGELNRSVILRQFTAGRTSSGAVTATASTLATVWAKRTDTGGQESFQGRAIVAEVSAVFLIRWRSDVTPQLQVVDGSDVFEIVAVQNARPAGGGWEALELMCKRTGV